MHFNTIIVCVASGSTLAGMVVGSKFYPGYGPTTNISRRIIGSSAFAKPAAEMQDHVLAIARSTAEKVGLSAVEITADDICIHDRYDAGAYGKVNDATREAVKLVASTEGILLDPVYTGKAMAGLIGKLRSGELKDAKNVLFVHTGGQAVLSAYPSVR